MTHAEDEIPVVIRPYQKEGTALHIEQTTQNIIDNLDGPSVTDTILKPSDDWLTERFNNSVTGIYKREKSRRQIGYAAMGFVVARMAIPRMRDALYTEGSLAPPSDISDDYFDSLSIDTSDWRNIPPAEREAKRATYWLVDSCKTTLETLQANNHQVYQYFTSTHQSYLDAFKDWKQGPGKDRWPFIEVPQTASLSLIQALHGNINFGVSLVCARAIHHLIHKNPQASGEELETVATSSVEPISWISSEDRHFHWSSDWRLQQQTKGFIGGIPEDGARALLQCPVSKVTQPNDYMASVDGVSIMQDPDFASHEKTRHGPIARSATCSGNVFVRYPDAHSRGEARALFDALGFAPENGERFNLTGLALAMGVCIMKTLILPEYDANRRSNLEE